MYRIALIIKGNLYHSFLINERDSVNMPDIYTNTTVLYSYRYRQDNSDSKDWFQLLKVY